jgi:hypothetical protein
MDRAPLLLGWAIIVPTASRNDDVDEETAMEHVQNLLRLVEKLEQEAKHAARTCGRRELNALEVTAEQYLRLYRDLKARGEIE